MIEQLMPYAFIVALAITAIRGFSPGGITFFGRTAKGIAGKIIAVCCLVLAAIIMIFLPINQ